MPCMRKASVAVAVLMLCLVAPPLTAAPTRVQIEDNDFRPHIVGVSVGDAVRWTRASDSFGTHNVLGERKLIFSGPPTDGNIDYRARMSAGTFFYFCQVHGATMPGFVNVPPTIPAAPQGLPFTVRWATGTATTGGRFDVQFKLAKATRWRPWKSNVTGFLGSFGKKGKPVTVVKGKHDIFRARSQNKNGPSRWSPARSFRP